MASPLLPYANAILIVNTAPTITMVNGRITRDNAPSNNVIVQMFMKRQQAPTTELGSKKVPKAQNDGTILPGAGGEYYLHRGYALRYANTVNSGYPDVTFDDNITADNLPSHLVWTEITGQPSWLVPGVTGQYRLGNDPIGYYIVGGTSGTFGGIGIDETIYNEVGGVPIVLSVGEVQN